jgi:hypothetical protein
MAAKVLTGASIIKSLKINGLKNKSEKHRVLTGCLNSNLSDVLKLVNRIFSQFALLFGDAKNESYALRYERRLASKSLGSIVGPSHAPL